MIMLTRKQVEELPDGTILFLPQLKENVILGHYDFDEFYEYEGRWVTSVTSNQNTGICYIASFEDLMTGTIHK